MANMSTATINVNYT